MCGEPLAKGGGFCIGGMFGNGFGPICEVGIGNPTGTSLNGENGEFFGIEGLNNLEGESAGGGALILFMNRVRKAALAVDVGGAIGSYRGSGGLVK